jgi:hypothetical protein
MEMIMNPQARIAEIDKIFEDMEEKSRKLQEERNALASLTLPQTVAITLRERLNYRVDDAWWHEVNDGIHDWTGNVHTRYLTKAHTLLRQYDDDDDTFVAEIINKVADTLR